MSKNSYPKNPSYHQPVMPNAPPGPEGYPSYPPPQYTPYAYAAGVPAQHQAYPTANPNMMVTGPGYGNNPQQYAPPPAAPQPNPGYPVQQGFYQQPPPSVAMAHFDSGARFDGIASQNIPPPPPGCAPNAAQMVAAQGGTVIGTQKKANWFSGGSGGGMSFW